ncbi:uncharacterized protein [Mytilus edulis]|uniref:uncharacterized protein n=1 Tax=Mytilus edulis TaxID=6550 RepID=UPI0039F0F889
MAFLLLVFTILLCICCNRHKQRQTKTKYTEEDLDRPTAIDERFFANNVATRFDSFGRKYLQTFGGYWDNGSFESHEDNDRTSYLGKKSNFSGQSKNSKNGHKQKGLRNTYTSNGQNYNGRLSHI